MARNGRADRIRMLGTFRTWRDVWLRSVMRTKADVRQCHWFYEFTPQRGQESYNELAFVIAFRILLPPGTSAVEVGMLPQRPALAGLGDADPFH
jgi:hypothetical protein